MGWYRVVKTVKGHRYLYDQRSWREGKKVRTESRYIGPAGEGTGTGAGDSGVVITTDQSDISQAGLSDTAYHGSQVKQFDGTPRSTQGKMGNAFYLSSDKGKARAFGREKIVSDDIVNAKGETVKRTLREADAYPSSTVYEFSTKGLKIKIVADDNEFFRLLGGNEVEEADKAFRLMGYDGVYNKSTETYAIYTPEKLSLRVAQQP